MMKDDYIECARACDKDPKCRAFTWVKPGVKGVDAACCLKSGVPVATQDPNCISGMRIVAVNAPSTGPDTRYATQTSNVAEKKKNIIDAKTYTASTAQKSGSALAKQSAVPNVSGQWKSNIGLFYNITQNDNQFEWTVTKSIEKGQGVVKGNEVSASWSSPQGSGSSTGQISSIDTSGKAMQIDWKNGVRFFR